MSGISAHISVMRVREVRGTLLYTISTWVCVSFRMELFGIHCHSGGSVCIGVCLNACVVHLTMFNSILWCGYEVTSNCSWVTVAHVRYMSVNVQWF